MVGETVEKRSSEPLRAEDFGPFIERQIRCDNGRSALVTLGEEFKQQFGAGFRQRHKTQLVNNQELQIRQLLL